MGPLVIEALLIVAAIICVFIELVSAAPRRVSLLALAFLFFLLAELVAPLNGILVR